MTTEKLKDRIKKLSTPEAYLLLYLIMVDIRMSWGVTRIGFDTVIKRKKTAMHLADHLCLYAVIGRLWCMNRGDDGRWLRADISIGGYEGIERLSGIEPGEDGRCLIKDRSNNFIQIAHENIICLYDLLNFEL